jgi:hypothetical protein
VGACRMREFQLAHRGDERVPAPSRPHKVSLDLFLAMLPEAAFSDLCFFWASSTESRPEIPQSIRPLCASHGTLSSATRSLGSTAVSRPHYSRSFLPSPYVVLPTMPLPSSSYPRNPSFES